VSLPGREFTMKSLVVLLFSLVTVLVRPNNSKAQALDGIQLQAFTRSDFYRSLVDRALKAIPQAVFQKCSALKSDGSRVTILTPANFAASGFPNTGFWKQSFPVSGCGNDTTLNVYFSATADEKVNVLVGAPGDTHADYILQSDALKYARLGAQLAANDCNASGFEAKDTKFGGFDMSDSPVKDAGSYNGARPWRETWTMIGCGHTIDVPVYYFPGAKGTQIVAGGAKVK
jgi:hypothetical protein